MGTHEQECNESLSKDTNSKSETTEVKTAPKLQSVRSTSFLMTDDTKAGMEMEMTDLGIGAIDARDIVGSFDQAEMTTKGVRSSLNEYAGNEAARQALALIGDGYKRSISPDRLERKLSNILHSHFLFVRRGLFIQRLKLCGLNIGKMYYACMVGSPYESTLASIKDLKLFCKVDAVFGSGQGSIADLSPAHFTALWLDLKSNDEDRMLLLGFLQLMHDLYDAADRPQFPAAVANTPLPSTDAFNVVMSRNPLDHEIDEAVDDNKSQSGSSDDDEEVALGHSRSASLVNATIDPEELHQ